MAASADGPARGESAKAKESGAGRDRSAAGFSGPGGATVLRSSQGQHGAGAGRDGAGFGASFLWQQEVGAGSGFGSGERCGV